MLAGASMETVVGPNVMADGKTKATEAAAARDVRVNTEKKEAKCCC